MHKMSVTFQVGVNLPIALSGNFVPLIKGKPQTQRPELNGK